MLSNPLCVRLSLLPASRLTGAAASSSTSLSGSLSTETPHKQRSRQIHLSAARRMDSSSNGKKKVAESLIGLRRDMSDKYSTAEPALFRMAVKNFDRANASENDQVPPLFGAVPAIKAAATFLKEELNLNSSELQIEEHYFQQFVSSLPPRCNVQTIVQLADIVNKGGDAMLIVDAATRDEKELFLTFNQFCYRIPGRGSLSDAPASHRKVQCLENTCQETTPWVWEQIAVSAAQESVFTRLLGDANPRCGHYNASQDEESHHFEPTRYMGNIGYITEILISRFHIPFHRLKGVKVVHGPKAVLPDDWLNLAAWKVNKRLLFFETFNYTPGRSDWIHSGYITLY